MSDGSDGTLLDPSPSVSREVKVTSEDERDGDQGGEEGDHERVQERVRRDNLPSLGPLLERVDRSSDLLVGCEPEEHDRVDAVEVRDKERDREDEEQDVARDD